MTIDNDLMLLSAYLDGELSSHERINLEARLQQEPELQAELAELQQVVALIQSMPRTRAPRNYTLDPALYRRPKKISFFPALRYVSALAAALVMIFIGVLVALNGSRFSEKDSSAVVESVQTSSERTQVIEEVMEQPQENPQVNDVSPEIANAPSVLPQQKTATPAIMASGMEAASAENETRITPAASAGGQQAEDSASQPEQQGQPSVPSGSGGLVASTPPKPPEGDFEGMMVPTDMIPGSTAYEPPNFSAAEVQPTLITREFSLELLSEDFMTLLIRIRDLLGVFRYH